MFPTHFRMHHIVFEQTNKKKMLTQKNQQLKIRDNFDQFNSPIVVDPSRK